MTMPQPLPAPATLLDLPPALAPHGATALRHGPASARLAALTGEPAWALPLWRRDGRIAQRLAAFAEAVDRHDHAETQFLEKDETVLGAMRALQTARAQADLAAWEPLLAGFLRYVQLIQQTWEVWLRDGPRLARGTWDAAWSRRALERIDRLAVLPAVVVDQLPALTEAGWPGLEDLAALVAPSRERLAATPRGDDPAAEAWLHLRPLPEDLRAAWAPLLGRVTIDVPGPIGTTVWTEVAHSLPRLLGPLPTAGSGLTITLDGPADLGPEGFAIEPCPTGIALRAHGPAGALHAWWELQRRLRLGLRPGQAATRQVPHHDLRVLNHWDDLCGKTERVYAGSSLFQFLWEGSDADDGRIAAHARLLSAAGINALVPNNVNAQPQFLTPRLLDRLAHLADLHRPWGIRLLLAVNLDAPRIIGQLPSSDPLDPAVRAWWARTVAAIYQRIPDFAGLLVKADSEGMPGPIDAGRTHADGANCLAEALAPHGGVVFWRTFMYGFDRRRPDLSAGDYFAELDGTFRPNVILQVKHGPHDFQIREPLHPLFEVLTRTNRALELQITQEYTGHTTQLVFLPMVWAEVLGHPANEGLPGPTVLERNRHQHAPGCPTALVAVGGSADVANWFGHYGAGANTYAFGRLAWDGTRRPEDLAREWAALCLPGPAGELLAEALIASADRYADGTHPRGLLMPVEPCYHLEPDAERFRHFNGVTATGIGKDRRPATPGSQARFLPPQARARLEDPATTPPALLLYYHHLPWDHRLPDGSTLARDLRRRITSATAACVILEARWSAIEAPAWIRDHLAERFAAQTRHQRRWQAMLLAHLPEDPV